MESLKGHISHGVLTTALAVVIGVGTWVYLEYAVTKHSSESPETGAANNFGGKPNGRVDLGSPGDKHILPVFGPPQEANETGNQDEVYNTPGTILNPGQRDTSEKHIVTSDTTKPSAPVLSSDTVNIKKDTSQTAHSNPVKAAALDTSHMKNRIDTTAARADTTGLDTMKVSAWLNGTRHDHPQAQIFPQYRYPLFLYSDIIQHVATIDTSGEFVSVRETLWGKDVRIPLEVPLTDYVKLEQEYLVGKTWDDLAHAYITSLQKDQLGSLMSGITNIDIPIPANPVLSIFGPPRINLKISGAVNIHGAWRNQKTNAQTLSTIGNVTNQPDFSQDVQINVNGTVGDKLGIGANWDTQNQFDYENQLHIKYTGYDDEIVQSVEAGNVSMSTPSSFVGSSQALFGIKAQMQFGALTLTALASQQKAQGKSLTVSGGSQSQQFQLHAYDYATNHFFIDTTYIGSLGAKRGYEYFYQTPGQPYDPNLLITDYEVYESVAGYSPGNTNIRDGVAVMDLHPLNTDKAYYDSLRAQASITTQSGSVEYGKFVKLTPDQFSLNTKTGVLTLTQAFQPEVIIAIAYKRQDGTVYGTFSYADTSKSTLVLKLVKPANLIPSYTEAWRLQLRNIFPVGGLNLDQNSLQNVKILYQLPGQPAQDNINGIPLLQVFGLDKTGAGGTGPPDNQFDWNPGVDIDPVHGEIIMPYVQPFVEALQQPANGQTIPNADSLIYASVYDTTHEAAMNDATHDRFLLTGSYTSTTTSHYNLGFNLVQGSVKVLLNGNPLAPDVDYTVDYLTGEVNIRNQSALQAGANVQIQYETNDLFQIASKSLTGLRGDYKVSDQTSLGFTLMNFSQQSPNDKVQLGEEPINNLIFGVDGGTAADLPFLTKALDALPLIQTAAPSRITLHGEAAYMLPNPNTRTSIIPDDNGQGIAYIDDFEGSKRIIPLPITYSNWTLASTPDSTALDSVYQGIPDSSKNNFRAWTYWFNDTPPATKINDIWPQKQVATDQQFMTVLHVGLLDSVRGQYNNSRNIDSTLKRNPKLAWGGFMSVLSSNASDLTTQNINYLEIWMKIDQIHGNGTMHVDLGQIGEDIFGDRQLHTEDSTGYGTLSDDAHDVGLDGLNDAQERQKYPWVVADPDRPWDTGGTDPEGDDYYANVSGQDYTRVNGTDGNRVSLNGKFPDTEDLNHNGLLDLTNNYFEYSVKLDTVRNPYITGGGSNGWYQYIIPLKDASMTVGTPSLSVVQYVRIWFDGMTGPMYTRIAEMNLVGNYWRTPNQNDTTMQVSVVNIFDNFPDYKAPIDGLQPVDHTNPTQNIQLNEQSLSLILNGLHDGDSRYVFKTFPTALNVFHYKTMKFFVHDDPKFNYVDSTNYDADMFIRFGSDSLDFYEYRQPLRYINQPPLRPGWQDVAINFARLTAIKLARDSVTQIMSRVPADNRVPGSTYWIQGNPSLQNVSYFQIGVENPANSGTTAPLNGAVWIDELRLTNVDNTPGLAYMFNASVQLADIGSLAFNFSRTDPYFHGLTTQFGSLNTQRNWALSASLSLERLLPREWQGTTIPFSYSHSETFSDPLYLASSDILVTQAVQNRTAYLVAQKGLSPSAAASEADSLRVSSQILRVADAWGLPSVRIAVPSTKWYIRDILDNITLGYNWSGSKYRDTQIKSGNQWGWNFSSSYSVQLDPMAYFTPFPSTAKTPVVTNPRRESLVPPSQENAGSQVQPVTGTSGQDFQIRYLPNSLNFSMSAARSFTTETYWTQSTPRITPNFTAQRSGGINWHLTNNGYLNPSIDYRFSINSSLLYIDADTSTGTPRPNSYVFRQIFLNNGLINFGQDYDFTQQFSLTTQPRAPFNLQQYVDLQGSYNSSYHWSNSLQQHTYGVGSGVSSSLQLGSSLRLKMLTDPWFGAGTTATAAPGQPIQQPTSRGRGHGREEFENIDTTASHKNGSALGNIVNLLVKVPFLDFDNIALNFTSANTSQNGGLPSARPGMGNFFKVPFVQESNPALGPSQLYQLGLVSDPFGRLSFVKHNGFPFIGFETTPGVRIPNANITDNYSNSNNVDIRTSRNLWQGARIDLSWHVAWSYNRNTTFLTDASGNPIDSLETVMVAGQVSRSFFTLPPVLIFSAFKSGINQVAADFQTLRNDPTDLRTDDQKLSQAFVQGFETLPFLDKIFGQYMPRMNYAFHWDGLEQLPLFKSFTSHVSLDHAYQSTYSENWHITNGANQITDAQTVSYGFQPLVGLNIAFKNIGDATISSSVQYNTSTQYSLNPSARTIAEQYTGQLSITATYSKRGFAIPLFGLSLQNDVDISASYSSAMSNQISYSSDNIASGGTPINGTNQTTLELRFRYVVSQRVTASVYYRNTRIVPTVTGSLIPGTTTNEAGVDVQVSIAG